MNYHPSQGKNGWNYPSVFKDIYTMAFFDPDGKPFQPSQNNSSRYPRKHLHDMRDQTMPNWLLRDLCFQQQIGVFYAPPGSFKSYVALDLASRLVHGQEWQGRKLTPCRAVYVAGEGYVMFYHRRRAWFQHNNIPEPDHDGLEVIPCPVDLTSRETTQEFIDEIKQDADGIGLIVFDTLSTCIAGMNESDASVMSLVTAHARLIADQLHATVLLIHHPGKDISKGSRGSSALPANIDFEWQLVRNKPDMQALLTVRKQKDGLDGHMFSFEASEVFLDLYDEDGIERSSLVLSPGISAATEQSRAAQAEQIKAAKAEQLKQRVSADLRSVAYQMRHDEPLSLRKLAKKMLPIFGCELRSAIDRINAAVPVEWTKVARNTDAVHVRRVAASQQGQPAIIECNVVNSPKIHVF